MASVKVVTPNFRHLIVKISPNMTLLQILEESCTRASLNPNDHDLKHHRTILDLSSMFRFSGLPTNCELEMIPLAKPRKDVDNNEITIVLQTEERGRLEGTFKPVTTLLDIVKQLCPEEAAIESNPVIIYMRTDVQGEQLASTTLKTLGLTSGRGLLRLIHKSAEQLKTQANVSGNLPVKAVAKDQEEQPFKPRQMKLESSSSSVEVAKEEVKIDEPVAGPSRPETTTPKEQQQQPVVVDPPKKRHLEFTKEDLDRLELETKRLDDQNTIIYSLESVVNSSSELPDSFFDITVSDMRVLLSQMKENMRSMDNAPLMTSKLRELEESKKTLIQLQYKETLIRVQFPDSRLVLQTVFKPIDTINHVKQFLRSFLIENVKEFDLFTTPPKTILDDEKRLVELHCVPQALIHFGGTGDVIKPEFLNQLSTAAAADFLAAKLRGRIEMMDGSVNGGAESTELEPMEVTGADDQEPKKRIVGTFKVSSTVTTEKGALPKWFKPAK